MDAGLVSSLVDAPSWLMPQAASAAEEADLNSPLFRFSSDGKLMADLLTEPECACTLQEPPGLQHLCVACPASLACPSAQPARRNALHWGSDLSTPLRRSAAPLHFLEPEGAGPAPDTAKSAAGTAPGAPSLPMGVDGAAEVWPPQAAVLGQLHCKAVWHLCSCGLRTGARALCLRLPAATPARGRAWISLLWA